MALAEKEYESSIGAEKISTTYKWVLNDWSLLYDIYYSKYVKSQKFLLDGTAGILCQLILLPNQKSGSSKNKSDVPKNKSDANAWIIFKLSQKSTFLAMVITISSINNQMVRTDLATEVYKKSVPPNIALPLPVYFPKNHPDLFEDALTIFVEFTIVKSIITHSFHDDMDGDNFGGSFRENLKDILDSKNFHDVTFDIGDEKLFAHKVILAAKSEVFKAMFSSGTKEDVGSTIVITDIEAQVFAQFLNYIYIGKVKNLERIAGKMIIVADKYQVDDLKTMCENYISAYLHIGNVVQYLLIAYKLRCNGLKKKALDLMKLNTHVLANEANYRLLIDHPTLLREVFSEQP